MSWDANGSPVIDEDQKKTCKECRKSFALSCFDKNKFSRDGLNYYCKSCVEEHRAMKGRKAYTQHEHTSHGSTN